MPSSSVVMFFSIVASLISGVLLSASSPLILTKMVAQIETQEVSVDPDDIHITTDPKIVKVDVPVYVYDNTRLIGLCVLGSVIGAVVSLAVFGTKSKWDDNKYTDKERSLLKWAASMCCGVGLPPLMYEFAGIPTNPNTVMGISFACAFAGVVVLHMLGQKLEEIFNGFYEWFMKKFFNKGQ